jgi:hypothetical protein
MKYLPFLLLLFTGSLQAGVINGGPNKAALSQSVTISSGPSATFSCTNTSAGDSWINPGNATADDDVDATVGVLAATRLLTCTQYGFSIPGGSTITGILFEFERQSAADDITDGDIRLTKDGTTAVGDDKAVNSWPTVPAIASYGGSSDLWGTTWTDSEINASTFGSMIRATTSGGDTASVDYCRVTVYYR